MRSLPAAPLARPMHVSFVLPTLALVLPLPNNFSEVCFKRDANVILA